MSEYYSFNVLNNAMLICDSWEKEQGPLPPLCRGIILLIARRITLDAARICDMRASVAEWQSVRSEATKCGDAIRHFLLCREGESICLLCNGEGCPTCNKIGIVKTAKSSAN